MKKINNDFTIKAISPIDGRYSSQINEEINNINSEYGLIKKRLFVEIEWLLFLASLPGIKNKFSINKVEKNFIKNIYSKFSTKDALKIKSIEEKINHDVKSIEYYLIEKFDSNKSLKNKKELIHFCATSEDINNISYALMFKENKILLIKELNKLIKEINFLVKKYSNTPMLSRTHGQKASPTTFGKEMKVFSSRLKKQMENIDKRKIYAKMNGAVGNYNAHNFVLPNIKWDQETKKFLKKIGLYQNEYTTQIENHDWLAESLNDIIIISGILLDFSKDIWIYIMLDYIKQKNISSEVGSSTMPHKVNPINFENAEGNLEILIGICQTVSKKIISSRLQRDLSDSTVLRNIGLIFAYYHISVTSIQKGMRKIDLNLDKINYDIDSSWEILAEPIQTIMRYYKIPNSYDLIKKATRGKPIDQNSLIKIIENSGLDNIAKEKLLKLKPRDYIGLAKKLALKKI
jgi:adenylosuccinate lyase|tara:strand:- start:2671 stop:4053 length:1383 start_codon:yes stop_codon:yes gene_type:complete